MWNSRAHQLVVHRSILKGGSAGRKGGYIPPEAAQNALDLIEGGIAAVENHAET
jgi:hypothetical protein